MDAPRLFDSPPSPPTTRTIALTVKHGGAGALDQARLRADAARYQEITCRSALNPVKGMPFNWTLNPYRGCTHACHYCFARRYQTQFELGPGDEFSSLILVKVNLIDVLRRELDKPAWTREVVAVGTATDPYQPIEGHYKLTRRALEALRDARTPVGLVTKGPMVVRDIDLLVELGQRTGCTVCISVPTVNEEAWAALEPGTAHPMQRLRAVRQLRLAGINAGVLMSPVVPGFTTQPARLEATIKAIAAHGAAFMGANIMYLKGGTKDHFLNFVAQQFPDRLEGYRRMYPGAYAPKSYVETVRGLIGSLRDRYDVARRASEITPRGIAEDLALPPAEEQTVFVWK
ncbi:MAG: radical SAM protein [Vicinamibacterales bacterium]